MQKTILEKEQISNKNKLISELFSTFHYFPNFYYENELKEIYEQIKK